MGESSGVRPRRTPGLELRSRAFFSLMGGFLLLPVLPVQFTSVITAIVWSFAGPLPAAVFLLSGTFLHVDSMPIFSGLQDVVARILPSLSPVGDQAGAVASMLVGNLVTAYLFKLFVKKRILSRLPTSYRLAG